MVDLTLSRKNSGAKYHVRVLRHRSHEYNSASRTHDSKDSDVVSKSAQIDSGPGSIFSSLIQLQRSSSPDLSKSARTKIKVSTAVSDSTVIKGVTPASGQATSSKEFAGYVGLVVTTSRPHAVKEV